MKLSTLIALSLLLCSCATTPEQKFNSALKRANKTSHADRPAVYKKQLAQGNISPETYKTWMDGWNKENAERERQRIALHKKAEQQRREHARWLASLTPAQRLDLEMREREIQAQYAQMHFQQQQQRQAAIQGALYNFQQNLQQQQQINAYNARTDVLAQPQQVNVYQSGTINHNVRVAPNFYGY